MANYANTLAPKRAAAAKNKAQEVVYEANGKRLTLNPGMVKKYLVSGDADRVTDREIVVFMQMCANAGLDPWQREAYCIKYGDRPATMVIGKEAFQKRADADPNFDGQEAGIVVVDEDGSLQHREGSLVLPGEKLMGGWAKVWRKDRTHPSVAECSLEEYMGRKKDGSVNSQWSGKSATMIRKVALVQALREAFPARLGGLYTSEERGFAEPVEAAFTEVPEELPPDGQTPQQPSRPAAPQLSRPEPAPAVTVPGDAAQPAAAPAAASDEDDFFAGMEG